MVFVDLVEEYRLEPKWVRGWCREDGHCSGLDRQSSEWTAELEHIRGGHQQHRYSERGAKVAIVSDARPLS